MRAELMDKGVRGNVVADANRMGKFANELMAAGDDSATALLKAQIDDAALAMMMLVVARRAAPGLDRYAVKFERQLERGIEAIISNALDGRWRVSHDFDDDCGMDIVEIRLEKLKAGRSAKWDEKAKKAIRKRDNGVVDGYISALMRGLQNEVRRGFTFATLRDLHTSDETLAGVEKALVGDGFKVEIGKHHGKDTKYISVSLPVLEGKK